jgi:hypothetical protein
VKVAITEHLEASSSYCTCGLFGTLMKGRSERGRGTPGDMLKGKGTLGSR